MLDQIIEYYNMAQEILANNAFQEYGVIGLFFNSLLSATAIPLPTEILTSALLMGGESEYLVVIVLVIGSVLGGLINYSIGFGGNKLVRIFKKKKYDPFDIDMLEKRKTDVCGLLDEFNINEYDKVCEKHVKLWLSENMRLNRMIHLAKQKPFVMADKKKSHKILAKFGWAGIFFSAWIPVVGDLMLISAGAKKMNFKKYSLFMVSGKIVKSVIVVLGLGALLV